MKYKLLHLQFLVTVALSAIMAMAIISCSNDGTCHHEEPEIWASCDEVEFDYKSNVIKSVWIYGDVDGCQVTAGADWLANSYLDFDELVIRVTENTSTSSRIGNLFVFNPSGGNSLTIKVTQLGKTNSGGNNSGNTTYK
mgnify:FL=1